MKKIFKLYKLFIALFALFIVSVVSIYIYAYFAPKIALKSANRFYIYDKKDEIVYTGSGNNKWISLDDMSDNLINAIINTEDKNFYKHHGFDYLRIAKAMFNNIKNKSIVEGASTISQQYTKNMFLDFDKTWKRKIQEAFLTIRIEMHYDKDEILEGYLNTINLGQGNYGIENASNYYFNKDASDLSIEEATILAAIPRSPDNYNPISDKEKCFKRAKLLAKKLYENEAISKKEYNKLDYDKVVIYGNDNGNNLQTIMYYQDAVIDELKGLKNIPDSLIESKGLKIYTNLDMEAQTNLNNAVVNNMLDDDTQVAAVVVDPKTGGIIALTGGVNYALSQFNRATKSVRQVGSSIKPFLYYAALENGLTGSSTFLSESSTFVFSNNQLYSPSNYSDKYANKNITMAAAIAFSDNIYAVKTHLFLGEQTLVDSVHKAGIQAELKANPSLALGASEINLVDFARGYTTLASGGYKRDLHFINKVEDLNGNVLYKKEIKKDLVLNPSYLYILNDLLTCTYDSSFSDYTKPTMLRYASYFSRKYAIKSGTTSTDYMVAGYNPDILMIVWNGKDDSSNVSNEYSAINKKIWIETVESTLKDTEPSWYEQPDNVIGIPLDSVSGEETKDSSKVKVFYYVKGTEPNNE